LSARQAGLSAAPAPQLYGHPVHRAPQREGRQGARFLLHALRTKPLSVYCNEPCADAIIIVSMPVMDAMRDSSYLRQPQPHLRDPCGASIRDERANWRWSEHLCRKRTALARRHEPNRQPASKARSTRRAAVRPRLIAQMRDASRKAPQRRKATMRESANEHVACCPTSGADPTLDIATCAAPRRDDRHACLLMDAYLSSSPNQPAQL